MTFPIAYGSPMVRGRAALFVNDISGEFLGDDAWVEDCGPGATITYKGRRWEVVRVLWLSVYTPSCYIVKEFGS